MRHGIVIGELVDEQVGHASQRRGARGELVHHQAARHGSVISEASWLSHTLRRRQHAETRKE